LVNTDGLGTVTLNTSLSALSTMGIDFIEAGDLSGVGSVLIQGGIDGFDLDATDLSFADSVESNLNVALDVTDDIFNGTVSLSTNDLSSLNLMGIDTITGHNGTSVVINGFANGFTLSDLTDLGLSFDSDLDVTLNVGDATSLVAFGLTIDDLQAGSSFMLGTSDAAEQLKDMGIDFINGDGVSGVWEGPDED
jgi:hypothetical protein